MHELNNPFLILGIVIFLGLVGAKLIERLKNPQVVGYILVGVILGNSFFNIIPLKLVEGKTLGFVSNFALALIGFTIGGELSWLGLKTLGKSIITIAILESIGAFTLVFGVIFLIKGDLAWALLFGALASATAPAATVDVLWEYKSRGPLTTTLFAVVGIDDAVALFIYAISASLIKVILMPQRNLSIFSAIESSIFDIFGAIFFGVIFGIALHYLLKRIRKPNEMLILTLAFIGLVSGVALQYKMSLILTNMALGITVINLHPRNKRSFKSIAAITPPVFLFFFVLVGARLQIGLLPQLGTIGVAYIAMRVIGKSGGAYIGAIVGKAPETVKKYLGFGLLSQAGVAIGLAIEATRTFPKFGADGKELAVTAINVIAATTFIFQIFGPMATKYAIFKAKEVPETAK